MELVIFLILFIPLTLLRGWVILSLWGWFILPLGAPNIQMSQALGIALILSFVTTHSFNLKDKTTEEKVKEYIMIIIYPLFTVGLGYIYHAFF